MNLNSLLKNLLYLFLAKVN